MILLQLYLEFFKIGTVAFGGGYAVLPLINEFIVQDKGWMSLTEMTDLVSISNMTPGPIGINAATFVGSKVSGIAGSVVATLGFVTPSALLMLALGYLLFSTSRKLGFLDNMLKTLRPAVVGLIAIAAIDMAQAAILGGNGFVLLGKISLLELTTFIVGIVLYYNRVSLMRLIVLGALMGVGLSFII